MTNKSKPGSYAVQASLGCFSPTLLTDLDRLNSIQSDDLFPDAIGDDGPNATSGQVLSKWLHTPAKNGQPKRLFFENNDAEVNLEWLNSFKEAFLRATTSVSYKIRLQLYELTPIEPFELVNERTQEKLTLEKVSHYGGGDWLLKRCPIIVGETAAAVQWENDENSDANPIYFVPLSPPADEKEKEADQRNNEMFSTTPGPSGLAE